MTQSLSDKTYVENLVSDISKLIHNKQNQSQKTISKYNKGIAQKSKILNYSSENTKYFAGTENILNNAKFSYSGIINCLEQYKLNISLLRNRIMSLNDSSDINLIIKKEYDELLDHLYLTFTHFLNMEVIENNISKRSVFEYDGTNIYRTVKLTYISIAGNVINDDIAKIDNILLTNSDMILAIQIGEIVFNFYKSNGIETFSPMVLVDKLDLYEREVVQLENHITKNINVITQATDILNAIKLIS